MKIRVEDETVARRMVTTGKGKVIEFVEQKVKLMYDNGDVMTVEVTCRNGMPYAKGVYVVDDSSFFLDSYGRLSMRGLQLASAPLAAARSVG